MKLNKRQIQKIIQEEKAKILSEQFFDERDRDEVSYNIINHVIKFLQVEYPHEGEMEELVEDVSNFILSYEEFLQRNKGSYL